MCDILLEENSYAHAVLLSENERVYYRAISYIDRFASTSLGTTGN